MCGSFWMIPYLRFLSDLFVLWFHACRWDVSLMCYFSFIMLTHYVNSSVLNDVNPSAFNDVNTSYMFLCNESFRFPLILLLLWWLGSCSCYDDWATVLVMMTGQNKSWTHWESSQTSKMELTNSSILDVWVGFEYISGKYDFTIEACAERK